MAEREQHVAAGELVVPVADVDVLAVEDAAALGPVVEEGRVVLDAAGERQAELARGVGVAEQRVRDRVARLVAAVPRLHDGADPVDPRHLHGRARLHDHGRVRVRLGHRRDQVVEARGQLHVGAVAALGLPVGVQPRRHDDLVGGAGELRRVRDLRLGVDDLAAAEAEGAAAQEDAPAAELGGRRRAEGDLEAVRLALAEVVRPLLLDGRAAEERVPQRLPVRVVDHQVPVDVQVRGPRDHEPELPRGVLVGDERALERRVPEGRFDVRVLVVHEQELRLDDLDLVDGFSVWNFWSFSVDFHRDAGLSLERLRQVAQQGKHLVRILPDCVARRRS